MNVDTRFKRHRRMQDQEKDNKLTREDMKKLNRPSNIADL
jgi:hypothetical protein